MVPRISFRRFSSMFGAAALVVCLAGLASFWASHQAANAQDQGNNSVVGVWEVKVDGAPFKPHLFTFHSDGTFLSANPDAGDTNTSDSDGEGTWQTDQQGNGNTVTGIFKEYDASRGPNPSNPSNPPAGTFTGTLTVTYITVKGKHLFLSLYRTSGGDSDRPEWECTLHRHGILHRFPVRIRTEGFSRLNGAGLLRGTKYEET